MTLSSHLFGVACLTSWVILSLGMLALGPTESGVRAERGVGGVGK